MKKAETVETLLIVNTIGTRVVELEVDMSKVIKGIAMMLTINIISNNNTLKCCEGPIHKLMSGIKIIME